VDNRREWAFMVNKRHEYLGVVSIDDIDTHKPSSVEELRNLAQKEIGTCSPDSYLEELFSIAAESSYPIPVVDEKHRLKGVVRYRAIFESLSGTAAQNESEVADV
jgi:glycine betaine/proline transport system ATP-binding protein